jgi:hypothetical protein
MIAGERLELTRIRRPPFAVRLLFRSSVAFTFLGLLVSILEFFTGVRVAGAGLIALALWLLRYDLAWQSLRQPGLPRFMGSCLIVGYLWLAIGGALWLRSPAHSLPDRSMTPCCTQSSWVLSFP